MISDTEWDDWIEDGPTCTGLFDPLIVYESAEQCWEDAKERGFDIVKLGLNHYRYVKLVNYLREKTRQDSYYPDQASDLIEEILSQEPIGSVWDDEKYLQPVIEGDPLLCINTYDQDLSSSDSDEWSDEEKIPIAQYSAEELQARLKLALKELKATQRSLEDATILVSKLREVNMSLIEGDADGNNKDTDADRRVQELVRDAKITGDNKKQFLSYESGYFGAYAHFGIHDTMLKDKVRTEGYRDGIVKNPHLFKDKVVMDVGCGTGILSFFAVEAGAKKVIAVDNSDIIFSAMANAKQNGLDDKIIFIKNKVELVELPEGIEKVDIIISEWMGYCLFFECMLPSVLVARDKFCVGERSNATKVFPDKDVYGYKMDTMRGSVLKEPHVTTLPSDATLTTSALTKDVDMNRVDIVQLDFLSDFKMEVPEDEYTLHGFVAYFDIGFEEECKAVVIIPTGPKDITTHWEQTVFFLDEPIMLAKGDVITGQFGTKRGTQSHRDLAITLNFEVAGKVKKELHFDLV